MGTRVSSIVETPDSLLLSIETGETQCYRVKNGNIEFRPRSWADWRRLAPTDVLQHVRLRTIVAEWLKHRFDPMSAAAEG